MTKNRYTTLKKLRAKAILLWTRKLDAFKAATEDEDKFLEWQKAEEASTKAAKKYFREVERLK